VANERIQALLLELAAQVAEVRMAQGLTQSAVYPRQSLVSKVENGGDVRLSSLLMVLDRLGLQIRLEPRTSLRPPSATGMRVVEYTDGYISPLLRQHHVAD